MALSRSHTTPEVDRLARELAQLTGETEAEAVTRALRDRLEREKAARGKGDDLQAAAAKWQAHFREHYDVRPVTKEEWDEASGDDIGKAS